MIPAVSAATRPVVLLGDPVSHSLSPRIQNAAFRAAGVDGVYLALRCDAAALPGLLRGIAQGGGAGNVTLPHKALAASVLDRALPAVRETGACNTFWSEEALVVGDNTDVEGFLRAVEPLLEGARSGRWLLLGAGGAARAVVAAAKRLGVEEITILNRTPDRARDMARVMGGRGLRLIVADPSEHQEGVRFDLVVNATSLGLRDDDPLPIAPERCEGVGAAYDLVYRPGGTAWTRALTAGGVPTADGVSMLIHQGAAAFERWWGREAPTEEMQRALELP